MASLKTMLVHVLLLLLFVCIPAGGRNADAATVTLNQLSFTRTGGRTGGERKAEATVAGRHGSDSEWRTATQNTRSGRRLKAAAGNDSTDSTGETEDSTGDTEDAAGDDNTDSTGETGAAATGSTDSTDRETEVAACKKPLDTADKSCVCITKEINSKSDSGLSHRCPAKCISDLEAWKKCLSTQGSTTTAPDALLTVCQNNEDAKLPMCGGAAKGALPTTVNWIIIGTLSIGALVLLAAFDKHV